jgi:hypothetical protein
VPDREEQISLSEAARRSGVSSATLKRWAAAKVIPVRKGRWTEAAAAQARVVARMRERGRRAEERHEALDQLLLQPGPRGRLLAQDGHVAVARQQILDVPEGKSPIAHGSAQLL